MMLVVVCLAFLGFGVLIPVVPLYAKHFGASEFVIGLLIASYALMQFIFAPALGRVSDRFGRRSVLLWTIAGNVLAYVVFALAGNIIVLFVARALNGVMSANVAVAQAYVADTLDEEHRAKGFGLLGAAFGLGLVFGPALGGVFSSESVVLFVSDALPSLASVVTPYSLPGFVTAGLAAGNYVLVALLLPSTGADGGEASVQPSDGEGGASADVEKRDTGMARQLVGVRRLVRDRLVFGLVVSYALRSVAYASMTSMFVVFTADVYGYGPAINGYILAFVGIVVAVMQGTVVDRVIKAVGEYRAIIAGASVEVVGLFLLPVAPLLGDLLPGSALSEIHTLVTPQLVALLLIMALLAAGDAFTTVSLNTVVSLLSPDDRQGENLGFVQSGDGLARAVGPVVAGGLYTIVGFWAPFVVGGLVMVFVIPVVFRVKQNDERTASTVESDPHTCQSHG
jgi:MFS family permease